MANLIGTAVQNTANMGLVSQDGYMGVGADGYSQTSTLPVVSLIKAFARTGVGTWTCTLQDTWPRAAITLSSPLVRFRVDPINQLGIVPSPLGNFAVLAAAGITVTTSATVVGDIGTFPTTTETGFNLLTQTGTNHAGDVVTQAAMLALNAQYVAAHALTPTHDLTSDLNGVTLVPGVYFNSVAGTFSNSGTVTFSGHGAYVMQAASTLITSTSSNMVLTNGALASDITWVVGSSATLGNSSHLEGSVLANTSITANTGATVNGRLLAGAVTSSGAVTLNVTTVNAPVVASGSILLTVYLSDNINVNTVPGQGVINYEFVNLAGVPTDLPANGGFRFSVGVVNDNLYL